jgi:hypothetical protein
MIQMDHLIEVVKKREEMTKTLGTMHSQYNSLGITWQETSLTMSVRSTTLRSTGFITDHLSHALRPP